MPSRSSAFSSTLRPLYVTPRWSRICTTWPENPHCGNCGVPFMNSTTSFAFTSLSMNCLIAMDQGPVGRRRALGSDRASSVAMLTDICSPDSISTSNAAGNRCKSSNWGCVKGAFHLKNIVLIEPRHFHDGARRIGPNAPEFLLNPVHQRPQPRHVGDVDHEAHAVGQAGALRFRDGFHVLESLPYARFLAREHGIARRFDAAHAG